MVLRKDPYNAHLKRVRKLMENEDTERGQGLLKKFNIVFIQNKGEVKKICRRSEPIYDL